MGEEGDVSFKDKLDAGKKMIWIMKRITYIICLAVVFIVLFLLLLILVILFATGVLGGKCGDVACIDITEESFGTTKGGEEVKRFLLKSSSGLELGVLNYGATISSMKPPSEDTSVVNEGKSIKDYENDENSGIYGPNIAGKDAANWGKAIWTHEKSCSELKLTHSSENVDASVSFTVKDDYVNIKYTAFVTGADARINIAHLMPFKQAQGSNSTKYSITVPSTSYLPAKADGTFESSFKNTAGTKADFNKGKEVSSLGMFAWKTKGPNGKKKAAEISMGKKSVEIFTTQPIVMMQIINGTLLASVEGLPDTVAGSPLLSEGSTYMNEVWYRLG